MRQPLREGEGKLRFVKDTNTSRNNSSPQARAGKGKMNPVNRLLIIDDDHGLVNLLKRFLEGEGFHVDAAYDQASGLSAALSDDHELIILDVMLPGGTGFELLKSLRVAVVGSGAAADGARRSGRPHPGPGNRRR